MAAAESEEERQAVRQEFIEAMRGIRGITQEHRSDKLSGLAAQFGITGTAQQEQFMQQMDQLMDDPLFQPGGLRNVMFRGRGGSRGGGSRGGGFGGGGFGAGRGPRGE